MKIKRKEWAKLNAELIYLRKVIKGRIKILATDDRPLVDVDLEECYLAAKYGNNPSEIMQGPITFQITAPDQATGYDHFMVKHQGQNGEAGNHEVARHVQHHIHHGAHHGS